MIRKNSVSAALIFVGLTLSIGTPLTAAPKGSVAKPDFTQGGTIPKDAAKDWNLGATGLRGWMYFERLETSKARQVAITAVDKGSPADGTFQVGDVLLGVAGKAFSSDPRTEIGKALTAAESEKGKGSSGSSVGGMGRRKR